MTRGHLRHGRPFDVVAGATRVTLAPATESRVEGTTISLTLADAERIAALRPQRGILAWPELPFLRVEIRPSEIKDQTGRVVRVVG